MILRWRGRPSRLAGMCSIAAQTLLLLSPAGSYAAEPAYRFEMLGTVPWGDGDTAVGYERGFDRNRGPIGFAVVGDSICFLDDVQRRVKIFDARTGEVAVRLPSFPAPYLLDLAVRDDGTLYLLDIENTVHVYAPGESRPRAVAPVSRRLRNIKGLLLAGDTLYVHTSSQFVYPVVADGRILTPEEQERDFREGLPSSVPGFFSTAVEERRTGVIRRRDSRGVVEAEWPLRISGPPLLTLIFEGALVDGRVVVTAEQANPAGRPDVFREILVCDGGEIVYAVRLPFIYHTYAARDLVVRPSGEIFHMLSDEDGVSFIRLRPDPEGRPRRLDYPAAYDRILHFNERLRSGARELPER